MKSPISAVALLLATLAPLVLAQPIKEYSGVIRVVNMAPEGGTCQTPVWVGIHNGTFDIYNLGAQASASLESLAEEGVVLPLVREFNRDAGGIWDGVVGDGPICPGEATKIKFSIIFLTGQPLYLSYASMVIPSNDAFIANGNPKAHKVFNADGSPAFEDALLFRVYGDKVLDAGTELNDEIPENTAFFGQTSPNSGFSVIPFGAVVAPHPGFKPKGSGGILDSGNFANADFTADRYKMMRLVMFFDDEEPDIDDESSPDDGDDSPEETEPPIPVDAGLS